MKIRLAGPILKDSIVDGPGIRAVIWTQGCKHACPGCHNPETHSFTGGTLYDVEDIKHKIDELVDQDGVTFSGGDPMYQIEACLELAKYIKTKNLNIWCYTGFTFENILEKAKENKDYLDFLEQIDVVVDGPFILSKRSLSTLYKGSTNQRLIDVPKSLKENKTITIEEKDRRLKQEKKECIFI
jgi:anaerobic ribonucleoside-triphosphate reductase activating protein